MLHRGKRKYDRWKVSESHKEGSEDILENLHCWEYIISVPATRWIFIWTWLICYSFIPRPFGLCQTLGESRIHAKFHETQSKTTPLNWAWPRITRADQSHHSFKVGQVKSVRFHWCGCHKHKALRWKLIIIWAGCLDKSMTGSPRWMRGKCRRVLSFHLFCIYLTITILGDVLRRH